MHVLRLKDSRAEIAQNTSPQSAGYTEADTLLCIAFNLFMLTQFTLDKTQTKKAT